MQEFFKGNENLSKAIADMADYVKTGDYSKLRIIAQNANDDVTTYWLAPADRQNEAKALYNKLNDPDWLDCCNFSEAKDALYDAFRVLKVNFDGVINHNDELTADYNLCTAPDSMHPWAFKDMVPDFDGDGIGDDVEESYNNKILALIATGENMHITPDQINALKNYVEYNAACESLYNKGRAPLVSAY